MYVAINNQDLIMLNKDEHTKSNNSTDYTVHIGFFKPNGYFHITRTFNDQGSAHKFIHYLNGGAMEK